MSRICRAGAAARSLARFLGASRARSFGAAAAIQVEYESDDEFEFDRRRGIAGMADACGEAEGRGVQWVFMGSPSARRHVYANRIAQLLGVPYISMGGLVRQELHPLSSLYKQIANAVNEGNLVPEDIIFALLSQRLEEGYAKGERGFILDGIPRTMVQAEILDQVADIDLVVNLKCMEDCLAKKHLGGNICPPCAASDNNGICKLSASKSCVSVRMQHSKLEAPSAIDDGKFSKLLEDYYRKQRKLLDFQVSDGPRETWRGLLAALRLQHIDAISSLPTLTP
ncbi:unnamed protein product [Spirodela intermedia]|uniref:adenylate kinase n=1 Tax=Spirodela intermedia TaxID=51605 RepID=A0A7I8IQB9_SPIIN|nr:unnamed protein product [Spirodela intermedia]CAA6660099.1 unnamed protein product [Spirodela intermedia]